MIEVMKQALEFFDNLAELRLLGHDGEPIRTTLRQAIKQAEKQDCWCHKCNEGRTVNGFPFSMTRMILCPDCGNKRCPKASDHTFPCTNSNEPGQPGSVYTTRQQREWVWQQAPIKTQWGDDMVVADLAIDKDHTVSVYCERDQTARVEAMFRGTNT